MAQLRSMTGYGSASGTVEGMEVTVELKSVNNRYLDCAVRLPRALQAERNASKKPYPARSAGKGGRICHGRVRRGGTDRVICVNRELAEGYHKALIQPGRQPGVGNRGQRLLHRPVSGRSDGGEKTAGPWPAGVRAGRDRRAGLWRSSIPCVPGKGPG